MATRECDLVEIADLCRTYGISKCKKVIRGGESRAHSVMLAALEASEGTELLAVQDGARPLVTPAAVAVNDTIKEADSSGIVVRTLERSALRAVQTPQVFSADLLKGALQSALEQQIPITDDCSAVERLGKEVLLIEGEESNLKITTPGDLILAEAILQAREES